MASVFDPVEVTPKIRFITIDQDAEVITCRIAAPKKPVQRQVRFDELPQGWAGEPISSLKGMLKDAIIAQEPVDEPS